MEKDSKSIRKKIQNLYDKIRKSEIDYARENLGVKVGHNSRVFDCRFGSEPFLIEIGNNTTVTGVTFLTHDGTTWLFRDKKGRRYYYNKIKVGNHVFVGVNSTILPGVIIEDNCIVAAGSIVTKSIPEGSIVAGNPARIIGDFFEYKERVLENYKSESQVDKNQNYKEKVLSILSNESKRFLQE